MERDNRTIKADLILIAAFLGAGLILAGILFLTARSGARVQVRVGGQVVQEFSLSEEAEYEITGVGGGHNHLVIRDGAAWIDVADCPDGLCRNMGKIRRRGQSVVCLPHQIVVEIAGVQEEKDADEVDVIVGA